MHSTALWSRAVSCVALMLSACGGEEGDTPEGRDPVAFQDGGAMSPPGDSGPPPCADDLPDTVEVMDPQLGCGHRKGPWTRYDIGIETDDVTGFAWTSLLDVWNDEELDVVCRTLTRGGLTGFHIPTIEEVRTLAAGCPQTLPEGTCEVRGNAPGDKGATCGGCEPGRGPHASGGYCRPELPDCLLLWNTNHCENDACGGHQHWFYAPETGAIGLRALQSSPVTAAVEGARGRCVLKLPPR